MKVVESDIFDSGEDGVVPTTEYHELVPEEGCRVLGSSDWTAAFRSDSSGEKFELGFRGAFILTCLVIDAFLIRLNIRSDPIQIFRLVAFFVDPTEHEKALLHDRRFSDQLLQWTDPHEPG